MASQDRAMMSRGSLRRSSRQEVLDRLAKAYIWWDTGASFGDDRILAQTMNIGAYEDIRLIEDLFGSERLAEIMRAAVPGWLSPRSWEFWRGRLARAGHTVPENPPKRTFDAAVL